MDDIADITIQKVQELNDLELAALLCLITNEHCLIATEDALVDTLEQELRLICAKTFGLTCTVLECTGETTPDEFGHGTLIESANARSPISKALDQVDSSDDSEYFSASFNRPWRRSHSVLAPLESQQMAEVVIVKHLGRTIPQVQTQALELLRSKRVFTRTAVHTAPKRFLFIALVSASGANNLGSLLNDHFSISHYHTSEDGFPNLEDAQALSSSYDSHSPLKLKSNMSKQQSFSSSLFVTEEFEAFTAASTTVKVGADVRSYLHNIVVFLRLHRAVAGGVSALATRHFLAMVHALAPLHGLDYVTPSLVALAARKIYPHRVVLTRPENERSLQWGSSVTAVEEALEGVTVEDVINDVLSTVEAPV